MLEKFFVEMDDGMRQDSFILNKTVNYWMLENNYVLNYVTASMSKM